MVRIALWAPWAEMRGVRHDGDARYLLVSATKQIDPRRP